MAKENEIALIEITEARKVAVFNDPNEFDGLLKQIREKVGEMKPDTSTAKGRAEIISMAFKVTRTKTTIDEAGKILKSDAQKKVDQIDASRKRMRDVLDELAATTRAPVTEWENADKARVELHEKMIRDMKELTDITYGESAENIRLRVKNLKAYHPGDNDYEEFQERAEARYAASANILKIALESAEAREKEAEELAELRRQQAEQRELERKRQEEQAKAAEQERREKAEHDRKQEEQRRAEQAERDAERREAERKAAAQQQAEIDRLTREKAEADRKAVEAEERAERQAAEEARRKQMEADRLATENKAAEENEARIKKAKALRQQWQGEAQDDLYKALGDKKDVGAAVKAIIDGKIRHVTFG